MLAAYHRSYRDTFWPAPFFIGPRGDYPWWPLDIETVCEGDFPEPGKPWLVRWKRKRWTTRSGGVFARIVEIDYVYTAMRRQPSRRHWISPASWV